MRAVFAAVCLMSFVASAVPSDANDYAHYATYAANGWTIADRGEERCYAEFVSGGEIVLSFMGPYYFRSGESASGSVIHLAEETSYTLPKGDKYGDFPVLLVADDARIAVSGFATDLGGALVVDSGSLPTVIDLLAALPDKVTLSAMVKGKQIYAIELDGNRAAANSLEECTAFITAQNRPGTKTGPELGPPSLLPPPFGLSPESIEPPANEPILALPNAAPPSILPPSSLK